MLHLKTLKQDKKKVLIGAVFSVLFLAVVMVVVGRTVNDQSDLDAAAAKQHVPYCNLALSLPDQSGRVEFVLDSPNGQTEMRVESITGLLGINRAGGPPPDALVHFHVEFLASQEGQSRMRQLGGFGGASKLGELGDPQDSRYGYVLTITNPDPDGVRQFLDQGQRILISTSWRSRGSLVENIIRLDSGVAQVQLLPCAPES